ncbi:hypothetical protein GH714_023957 [Hevea brasiliensis]|uniref:Uncharacterized protein n=1 Tax=Hevea brasiliensis TaxID=3981 RepID=A0A6A6MKA9_HEVBR|nr:hypothetical protein GH714_023957 [Hevea brasiliensis]
MMISTGNGSSEGGGSSGSRGGGDSDVAPAAFHQGGGDMHANVHHGGGGKGGCSGGGDGNGEKHLKKGPWTAEEDGLLLEYVRKHGEGNWNAVQRHSGLARCGKSCRLRWANHLRPNLKKGAFSPEEERLIVELQAKFGNKWARMATLTPMRFKRFSSSPNIASLTTTNNTSTKSSISPNSHFSLPLSPLPPASASNKPLGHQMRSCFSCSEFHNELQKEDQEMCSHLAAVTQPELPSNQFLSTTNQNRNLGIGIATIGSKFGKRATKKKIGNSIKDKVNGNLGWALEDLLQEAKALTECGQTSTEQSSLVLQEQKPELLVSDGFDLHWDQTSSLALSSGLEPEVDIAGQINAMPEDFTKVLNILPSPMQPELYSDSADISNGPSSVLTDDNIGFEMQQIASLFPQQTMAGLLALALGITCQEFAENGFRFMLLWLLS